MPDDDDLDMVATRVDGTSEKRLPGWAMVLALVIYAVLFHYFVQFILLL